MNICRKCGAVLREGDKYCSKCGARASMGRIEARKKNAQKKKQEKEITFRTKPEHGPAYRENFAEGENRSHALLVTVTILVVMMLAVAAFAMFYFVQRRSMAGGSGYGNAIEIISDSALKETAAIEVSGGAGDASDPNAAAPAEGDAAAQAPAEGDAAQAPAEGDAAQAPAEGDAAQTPAEDATVQAAAGDDAAALQAAGETQAAEEAKEAGAAEAAAAESETPAAGEETVKVVMETESEAATEPETEPETQAPSPSAADVIDPAQIQSILDSESTATSSEVYIYDLKNDSEASVNDCTQQMYASALITIPILYTAATRIDAGELSMDDSITYYTTVGGRGEITTEVRDGQNYPLSFYLQTMTNYSDNNCTNILIDYLGLDSINATCQEAGYTSVNMERGIVAQDPGGLDNYMSAKDVTMMVKDLFSGKFSSIGEDYMRQYFKISETDSLPTLAGLAPSLAGASAVLNQNGHGSTRYNETILVEDGSALYIMTIMLYGDSGMVYSPAVTDVTEYIASAMKGG